MTLAVFLKIANDFIEKQLLIVEGTENMGPPGAAYATLGLLLLFAFVASWKAAQVALKESPDSNIRPALVGVLGTLGAFMFGVLLMKVESNIVCALCAIAAGAVLVQQILSSRPAKPDQGTGAKTLMKLGAVAILVGILIYMTRGFNGYSWSGPLSLTLLMWMAFIGASMATYQRRHLAIDAIRKVIPPSKTHFFNTIGYLLTAVATAAFFYLSWLYFQQRIGDVAEPGKIPDWVTLLSIPVALAMVTIRFVSYAIGELILGMRGHVPEEPNVLEEVA